MYTTLTEYKTFTGSTVSDAKIILALGMAQSMLDGVLDNQEQRQLTKTVAFSDFHRGQFRSSVMNIQSIDEINGETYGWTVNSDYKINWWRFNAAYIQDIGNYTLYDVPYFDITYTAGYSPVPWDLKYAHIQMTTLVLEQNGKSWKMKSYKLWPRTVVFADNAEVSSTIGSIESTLYSYMLP